MRVEDFDFQLPEELIALRPASPRDASRLLVVHGDGCLEHRRFSDLPDYLSGGDILVTNVSKVIPARLRGVRTGRGAEAKIEVLLHRRQASDRYAALARPARKLALGDRLKLGKDLIAEVLSLEGRGEVTLGFTLGGAALDAAIAAQGEMPLPPYIAGKRPADRRDAQDYQTVYASNPGSVAAPTAGLHFTPALLDALHAKGVGRAEVTLHVGLGTFLPVKVANLRDHRMHGETAILIPEIAARINAARAVGGRVAAVGTTAVRVLESAADRDGELHPMERETDIFIAPGYRFRAVDLMITNFHLPKSTLFMLVCGFMGLETMRAAYAEAIAKGYRFYSYGDACLLLGGRTL